MTNSIDKTMVDEAIGAYVEWREACAAVQDAYDRWARASSADAVLAFLDYAIALDTEEEASTAYAGPIGCLAATGTTEQRAAAAGGHYVGAAGWG
jgi:hypothetical protein